MCIYPISVTSNIKQIIKHLICLNYIPHVGNSTNKTGLKHLSNLHFNFLRTGFLKVIVGAI